ncbi:uncharacterized protein TrAFT101_004278 [Trichoderma asperellum]|uniref:uncharacterized protein n=1 Tax=Trichoderma asperellum TaxID=101201 RepID=UPI003324D835|nr:hypothetical protein TrAFT101_004278 [Trichoderma asperellum]
MVQRRHQSGLRGRPHEAIPNSGTALFRLPARRVHSSASQDQQGSAMGNMDEVGS